MSTDFNIKPVGAPVAAPIVQPISEAAQNAVATELPASQSVAASDAGVRANQFRCRPRFDFDCVSSVSNQVVIDRDAASIVYQVVDNRTSQVVKQFPEEAVLRRRAYFHALDLTKDAPSVCAPPTAGPETRTCSIKWKAAAAYGAKAVWRTRTPVQIGLSAGGIGDRRS